MKKRLTFSVVIEFDCDKCEKCVTDMLLNVPFDVKHEAKLMCSHCNTRFVTAIRIIESETAYGNYYPMNYGVRQIGNDPENPKAIVGEVIWD